MSVGRPSQVDLEEWLIRVRDLEVTYPEVGATRAATMPPAYRRDRYSVTLGHDETVFRLGRKAVQTWQAHLHTGATLEPPMPDIAVGTDIIVAWRIGPLSVVAPCRIVYVIDDEEAYGFAYGTLPGHPEQGEEAFRVVRGPGGAVAFEVVAFSRPADPLARLGSPIARFIQLRISRGYLEGVRSFVSAAS
jgi:uncharacterized protein (UPF0548 family)